MSFNVSSIQPIVPPRVEFEGTPSRSSQFQEILRGAVDQVELSHTNAVQGVERFLAGEGDDLHSTILAVQRAGLEFDMLMQVRNKVVSAYQEIMRMQM